MTSVAKKQRQAEETNSILEFCNEYEIPYRFVMPYQIRLNDRLDIYPQGQKYFHIPTKKWGEYEEISVLIDEIDKLEEENN